MRIKSSAFERTCFVLCVLPLVAYAILLLRPTTPTSELILPAKVRQAMKDASPPMLPVQISYASVGGALRTAHNTRSSRYALLRDYAVIMPSTKADWLDFKIQSDSAVFDIFRNSRELILEYPAFDTHDRKLVMLRTSIMATRKAFDPPTLVVAEPIVVSHLTLDGSPSPT